MKQSLQISSKKCVKKLRKYFDYELKMCMNPSFEKFQVEMTTSDFIWKLVDEKENCLKFHYQSLINTSVCECTISKT